MHVCDGTGVRERISWAIVAIVGIALTGCESKVPDSVRKGPGSRTPGLSRVMQSVAWDTLWSIRSSDADTVLVDPAGIVATSDLVVVLDRGMSRVIALHARTARLVWVAGRRGEGPGEFEWPAFIAADRSGGFVVGDREIGRLTFL
jgi:hypothetical protein